MKPKIDQKRALWMRQFQSLLPTSIQPHIDWNEPIYHYLSGKNPQEATTRYLTPHATHGGRKDQN